MAKNQGPDSPATQARQAAFAAVPTRGSINQQYGQSIGDVEGFSKALLGMLQKGPGIGAGYQTALANQTGIDAAARAALGATGTPYAGRSTGAVAGLGASALSNLNARGAAASQYGATLPHVAAARGEFGVQSLENARQQALTQRNQSYQQAYLQALQQARSNAFNQRIALADLGLKRQSLAFQRNQANLNRLETKREFNLNNALQWAQLGAGGQSGGGGAGGGVSRRTLAQQLGLTQNELDSHVSTAVKLLQGESPGTKTVAVYGPVDPATGKRYITGYKTVPVQGSGSTGAVQAGVPFEKAVQTLIGQGIRPQVALLATSRLYRSSKAVNVYAWETFIRWMAGHGSQKYQKVWKQWNRSSNTPVSFGGQPH